MTNERFDFNDGKLHWISDEDTLIVEGWPSLKSQYIQGTAPDPFWIPHKHFPDALIPQSRKSLARLLYPARVRLVLGIPAVEVPPDDPRYYTAPIFTDRLFRERSGPMIAANRAPLQQFLATIPPRYLDEIIKYECENDLVAHTLALDERLYDLSVSFPIFFLLIVLFAHHKSPNFNDVLNTGHNCSFDLELSTIVDTPDSFLIDCAGQDPINILHAMGHKCPNALLRLLKKYDCTDSMYRYIRYSFVATPKNDSEPDWHDGLDVLNSRVLWSFPDFIPLASRQLLDDIIHHPYADGYSTESCYWMFRLLWSWSRPAGGERLSTKELAECKSALELLQLYKRILVQALDSWPKLAVEKKFPIDTPELRPILNTEELKAAAIENLNPLLSCHCGPGAFSKHEYFYRLLSPVKGILECIYDDESCVIDLYLDCGVKASRFAAREFWLKACNETDWTGYPDELREQAFKCILPSNSGDTE